MIFAGTTTKTVVLVVSFLAVVLVGIAVGLHIWIWRQKITEETKR